MKSEKPEEYFPTRDFHVSKKVRKKYQIENTLFQLSGEVVLYDFSTIRNLTQLLNKNRHQPLYASDLNALGLIHESIHYVISLYKKQSNSDIFKESIISISEIIKKDKLEILFQKYIKEFPPKDVFNKVKTSISYLNGNTDGVSNRQIILEEVVLLWLENQNLAFQPFNVLFDDSYLAKNTKYSEIISILIKYFDKQPKFGPDSQNLIELLRMPAIIAPNSLQKQLEYIRDRWGYILGDFLQNILRALDFISEEKKMRGFGPGEIKIPNYFGEDEYERFSPDREWMPKVVMIAKNVYVWMNQLSKQYKRHIGHLNEVPNEELDKLAGYGFTSLWLIGLWERSKASKEIKRMCGNPEAEASAYSLMGYEIAYDIGGWDAFHNLRQRCWKRGIRMASDMVPNHTGIDSHWVIEHPDWFLSLDYSPFPTYTFNGKNLSEDERVGVFIEDKYYSQQDAAVVFKRVDYWTGAEKYIYHGNDGTAMPWNDTAQLDYLNPEVRETVIQTILHVARNFPIIRFDAAMTLAKKHLQRLWYPEPGTGSVISSRAEFGLSSHEFNDRIPNEFWREVVDRVAAEVPDTLLLAEAFWMMESYFVRTLGMHRVYNSAFMNMLKMERNADYRTTIKKTLEFDPEILKRFVNFLNNPDEETAAKQFGKGDKYFGVALLMITMPGLPMFGHSQIEGFEEKYGMEYRKAYWDEQPNWGFVERHKYDIFPVMHKRYLFSGVENYYLYDYFNSNGYVNENVFAYSNRFENERAMVFYNNSHENTTGWIKVSSAYIDKTSDSLKQTNIGDGLNLKNGFNHYLLLREHKSGLEFIRRTSDIFEKGIYTELSGYQYQVFWNMREVVDNEFGHYAELHDRLGGRGVKSIDAELQMHFRQKMDILFVSAEVAPFSKAGGLADVVGSLPQEISIKGQKVAVITPFYSVIDEKKYDIKFSGIHGNIQLGDNYIEYNLYQFMDDNGVDIFFVKNEHFFNRIGIYTDETGEGYKDNFQRFLFLQYVLLDLLDRGLFSAKLIHCNDHHTALIPWMLENRKIDIPTLLTIHNAEYQGWFSLDEAKLLHSSDFQNRDKRRKSYNALSIGIKYCDALNTVSLNYAKELLKNEKLSFGLKKFLQAHQDKFSGIINGADYSIWNPELDTFLTDHFSSKAISGKLKNKRLLIQKCNWKYSTQPVIGMVSRLVTRKGFYLILNSIDKILATGVKLVILGTGNTKISLALKKVAKKYSDQISFHNYFDEKMAHLIEAGSDMFLMPSRYEPCGLNQIYSLRYGTIPIVFNTGGLADTVTDWDGKNGDGFVFYHYTSRDLINIIEKSVKNYRDKKTWKKIVNNAMEKDYSWSNSAEKYLNLYTLILEEK